MRSLGLSDVSLCTITNYNGRKFMENELNQDGNRPKGSLDLGTIYHVVFRHKWKIVICLALGIIAAAISFVVIRPVYQSEAKLLIRYVLEAKSMSAVGVDSQVNA